MRISAAVGYSPMPVEPGEHEVGASIQATFDARSRRRTPNICSGVIPEHWPRRAPFLFGYSWRSFRIVAFTTLSGMFPAYTTLFARRVDLPHDGRGLQCARVHRA